MQLSFNVHVNLQAQGLQFTDLGLPQWNHAQYFQVMQNHSKILRLSVLSLKTTFLKKYLNCTNDLPLHLSLP